MPNSHRFELIGADILLYPALNANDDLADIYWRIAREYAPLIKKGANLIIADNANRAIPPCPIYIEPSEYKPKLINKIRFLNLLKAKKIIVWDSSRFTAAPLWNLGKYSIFDDKYDRETPDINLKEITFLLNSRTDNLEMAKKLKEAKDKAKAKYSLIIGSGNHALNDANFITSNKLKTNNIYIGASVFSDTLISKLNPNFIIATDAAAHLGPSKCASLYRNRIIELQQKYGSYIIVSKDNCASFLLDWPEDLIDKIIEIPISPSPEPSNNLFENFSISQSGNVLTSIAISLAATLNNEIIFCGISTKKDENSNSGYWRHYDDAKSQQRISYLLLAHPHFGNDAPDAYIANHFANLDKLIGNFNNLEKLFYKIGDNLEKIEINNIPNKKKKLLSHSFKKKIYDISNCFINRPIISSIIVVLFFLILNYFMNGVIPASLLVLFGSILAIICFCFLSIILIIRGKHARTIHTLSQQSTRQFDNLSKRISDLEYKIGNK